MTQERSEDREPQLKLEEFAATLRALREAFGLSQYALARESGVAHHTVHRLENAEIPRPFLDDIAKLADFFGVRLEALAAVLGVWSIPEQELEELEPELGQMLTDLRNLGLRLGEAEQRELAGMLEAVLLIWQRRERQAQEEADALGPAARRLPAWLRPRRKPPVE